MHKKSCIKLSDEENQYSSLYSCIYSRINHRLKKNEEKNVINYRVINIHERDISMNNSRTCS